MIYLVGLNHKYQLEGYEDNWVHFYEFVSKKAKTLDADLLVEMSEDDLKLYNTRNSVMSRGLELWAKPEESKQLRMGPMELYALDDRSNRKSLTLTGGAPCHL